MVEKICMVEKVVILSFEEFLKKYICMCVFVYMYVFIYKHLKPASMA